MQEDNVAKFSKNSMRRLVEYVMACVEAVEQAVTMPERLALVTTNL
jgi:hypothetical protein